MKRLCHIFAVIIIACLVCGCSKPSQSFQISVNFGKAWAYSPHSNEILDWSGTLTVEGGSLDSLFKLTYGITDWEKGYGGCSREYSGKLDKPEWATDIRPGSGRGLEGIRFFISGDSSTIITINTRAGSARFSLDSLIDLESLEFRIGGYYSFQPITVFLGPDARPRLSKKAYARQLAAENRTGTLLIPDDFTGSGTNFMSAWCTAIRPKESVKADFLSEGYGSRHDVFIPVKLQLMAAEPQKQDSRLETTSGWMEFVVGIGNYSARVRHFFTWFRQAEKLFDIYVNVPAIAFTEPENSISITNEDDTRTLLLHRAFINEAPASHRDNLKLLPPLPEDPNFWVGYDLNTSTPQDGEVDFLLNRMADEQIGNYLLFRIEENHTSTDDDFRRWGAMALKNNFKAGTTMMGRVPEILTQTLGANFLGVHQHECSNLIYGWGESEPIEARKNRTLPECEAAYTARMKSIKMLGQALPMCNLDYKSGVNFISSEFPTGHSTLMMASNRGGSYLYDKPFWGVHLANHVMRMPDDEGTLRRNFLFLWQSWLYGARLIYDEESAVYGIHSTSYSYSDQMSFIRRKQMQELFHYGSVIRLGKEQVKTGFLIGKYDCLVGGVQSSPEMDPTKVWGLFGPETDAWTFNTPERGWELLDIYMPGVWLYPVKQDNSRIRMFLGSSPNGQTDLVTIDGDLEKLKKYELLVLPGWNTMTGDNYAKLIEYVRNGGHLVISATQCTNHVSRNFLIDKKNFDFFNHGDLTELSGVRIDSLAPPVKKIRWKDGRSCQAEGLPGLNATIIRDTRVLAQSETGLPVLVEKSIGKGKVWTLLAGEYWGADALDDFRRQLGDTLKRIHQGDLYISGDIRDIDYHVYDLPDGLRRIAFLNTDWTQAGNTKDLILHFPGNEIPVAVKEGTLVNILTNGKFSLKNTVPGSCARFIGLSGENMTLSLSGTGKQDFWLYPGGSFGLVDQDTKSVILINNVLTVDFGEHWDERIIQLRFVQ